jgi:hypothetical protein
MISPVYEMLCRGLCYIKKSAHFVDYQKIFFIIKIK